MFANNNVHSVSAEKSSMSAEKSSRPDNGQGTSGSSLQQWSGKVNLENELEAALP